MEAVIARYAILTAPEVECEAFLLDVFTRSSFGLQPPPEEFQ